MKVYARSHTGRVRTVNQDAYYLPEAGESFVVVADGMGGHKAGEIASQIAVTEFSKCLKNAPLPNDGALRMAVSEANRVIYMRSCMDADKAGMGTTLTGIWADEEQVYLAHVGDSRAYLLRDGTINQLSRDHSLVGELIERGELTPEEAKVHPQRHVITRALGTNAYVTPDILRFARWPGDVWLLCSDGLTTYVSGEEIGVVLTGEGSWEEKIEVLVELALRRGGSDNITVVVVVLDDGGVQ